MVIAQVSILSLYFQVGARENKTAVDVCLGVLGSIGGVAVVGGLVALGYRLCQSQTGIVLQIQVLL